MAEPDFPLQVGDEGQRVKDAQWLLAGHNGYQIDTYHGAIDGIFGPQMAKATKDAKWRLGYPVKTILPIFGRDIRALLLKERLLPPLYRVRRLQRLRSLTKARSYPLSRRGALIGFPGQGTHSYTYLPNNWQSDRAVDIHIAEGTQVLAAATGVICATCGFGPLDNEDPRFAGQRFTLTFADGSDQAYYAHLKKIVVKRGQAVKAGDLLGYSGSANGVPHLHWALRHGDPVSFLKGL